MRNTLTPKQNTPPNMSSSSSSHPGTRKTTPWMSASIKTLTVHWHKLTIPVSHIGAQVYFAQHRFKHHLVDIIQDTLNSLFQCKLPRQPMTPERATVPTSIFRIGITKRDFHLGNTRHDPVFIASPSSACPPCSHKHYKHPPSPVHETNGPNNPVNHSDSTAHNRHVKHTTTHSHASHTPTYRNQTIKHIATTHCLSSG